VPLIAAFSGDGALLTLAGYSRQVGHMLTL
jgi:hypothetical protein